jgi:hypothetical protein
MTSRVEVMEVEVAVMVGAVNNKAAMATTKVVAMVEDSSRAAMATNSNSHMAEVEGEGDIIINKVAMAEVSSRVATVTNRSMVEATSRKEETMAGAEDTVDKMI